MPTMYRTRQSLQPPKPNNQHSRCRQQRRFSSIARSTWTECALDFGSQNTVVNQTINYLLSMSYVNDDYKIIVTTINKVGSSNWRRFMQDLHKISSENFRKAWPPLKLIRARPTVEIQQNLKEYTKVLFVRHPLVRLLSAYRDKFVKLPTSYYVNAAVKIIKIIRKQSPANLTKPDVTFTEFLIHLCTVPKVKVSTITGYGSSGNTNLVTCVMTS